MGGESDSQQRTCIWHVLCGNEIYLQNNQYEYLRVPTAHGKLKTGTVCMCEGPLLGKTPGSLKYWSNFFFVNSLILNMLLTEIPFPPSKH